MKREREEEEAVQQPQKKVVKKEEPPLVISARNVCLGCGQVCDKESLTRCDNFRCDKACCEMCLYDIKKDLWVRKGDFNSCAACFGEMRKWYRAMPDLFGLINDSVGFDSLSMVLRTRPAEELLYEFKDYIANCRKPSEKEQKMMIRVAHHLAGTELAGEMRWAVGRKKLALPLLYEAVMQDK